MCCFNKNIICLLEHIEPFKVCAKCTDLHVLQHSLTVSGRHTTLNSFIMPDNMSYWFLPAQINMKWVVCADNTIHFTGNTCRRSVFTGSFDVNKHPELVYLHHLCLPCKIIINVHLTFLQYNSQMQMIKQFYRC